MPWRGILPLIHLIVYTSLAWWGYQESCPAGAADTAVPPPLGYYLALAVNLPIILIGAPLAVVADRFLGGQPRCDQELIQLIALGVLIYTMWTWIGWRIDRRKERTPSRMPVARQRIFLTVAVALCGLVALTGLIATISQIAERSSMALFFGIVSAWFAAPCWSALRRLQQLRQVES